MKKAIFALICLLSAQAASANDTQKVTAVTEAITLTIPVDYIITATSTDEAITGTLDIANDQSVVIFENIKPNTISQSTLLKKIKINGKTAIKNSNCRLEVYRHGTILFPYGGTKCYPLTVYNEAGESKNNFTVWSKYTVLGAWDNAITRFTLKRGYMVTMANHTDGTGYSHCFVAQDEDIDVTLPAAMQKSVSFVRVFEWSYPGKKGLAEDNTKAAGNMNMGWFYNWAASGYQYENFDYVPQRHHDSGYTSNGEYKGGWPGWDEINGNKSCHVLGMNEPDNTSGAEVHITPEEMFKNHKNYLASGMRIGTFSCCNPNKDWVTRYVNLCKKNNMRIDFVATHYYLGGTSPDNFIGSLQDLHDATGLPIWVTEWNNGANWTSESGFQTDSRGWVGWSKDDHGWNHDINGSWFVDCLKKADRHTWIERLAIYNDVEYKRYVHYSDGSVTPAGKRIRDYNSALAYSKYNEVWMTWNSTSPSNLKGTLSEDGTQVTLTWKNPNTDCTKLTEVQERRTKGGEVTWETVLTFGVNDKTDRAETFDAALLTGDRVVRIINHDHDGKTRATSVASLDEGNESGLIALTSIPANYGDYYYMVYHADLDKNLCWGLQENEDVMMGFYQTAKTVGTTLAQIWQLEQGSSYSGYAFRCLGSPDYMICRQPSYWHFSSTSTHTGKTEAGYNLVYDVEQDYWMVQSTQNTSLYCGLWKNDGNYVDGAQIASDRNKADADHLRIYAIEKAEFNRLWLVENKHTDCRYMLGNPGLDWGTATIGVQGSGGSNSYPLRWTFQRDFSGWNDTKLVDATFSDGTTGKALNVWAGGIKSADLNQQVNGLPDGLYRLSAELATDEVARTETRLALYATPQNNDYNARSYELDGKGGDNFIPVELYVLVTDGTLTFGVHTDARWFKAGRFKLEYVCQPDEATADQLAGMDNARALARHNKQRTALWLDLSDLEHCRSLQLDLLRDNTIALLAGTATADEAYNPHNIIVGNQCRRLVLTDEQPLTTRGEFMAEEVQYRRNDAPGQWHTLFLPFAVKAGDGVELGRVLGISEEGRLQYTDTEESQANIPYLIRFEQSDLLFQDVNVYPTQTYQQGGIGGYYANASTITALRWYLNGKSDFDLDWTDEIIPIPHEQWANSQLSNSKWHDLQGRPLPHPLRPGLYIRGDKKVVVK